VSENLLSLYLDEYDETPWEALKFLIAAINYGGHVTDDWDRRLLNTYITDYFNEDAVATPFFKCVLVSQLPSVVCPSGCVVECRTCNHEGAGSYLGGGYLAPRCTQSTIPPWSVNEYQLRWEGKGRYGSFHLRMKSRVQVKLTLTMRAIPERLTDVSIIDAIQIDVPLSYLTYTLYCVDAVALAKELFVIIIVVVVGCGDVVTRLSILPTYYIPRDGSLSSYKEYVSMLPNMDHPEAFGQHPNADITSQIQETRMMFETLLSLQPQTASGVGESREEKVTYLRVRVSCNVSK